MNISAQSEESSLFTPPTQNQSQENFFQSQIKNENKELPEKIIEITPTIQSYKASEHKSTNKIDSIPKKDSEAGTELQSEHNDYIRIVNIEHKNSELPSNITQTFEMNFAHICVNFEGDPEELIILFKQMQNNPGFTKKIIQEAKLLAVN